MPILPRSANSREPNSLMIVLAVEGSDTEGQYFKPLGDGKIDIEILSTPKKGEFNGHCSPEHVEKRMDAFLVQTEGLVGGEFWLVMDVDDWPKQKLSKVCQRALSKGYQIAVSNPCFELWLWLHQNEPDETLDKCGKLEKALKKFPGGYNKSRLRVERFHPHIQNAIARSKALSGNDSHPVPGFPGTHVGRLVERILSPA